MKPQHHRFTKWTKDQSRTKKKCNCCVARTCEVIFEMKVQVPGSLCIFVCGGYNWHSECPTNVAHTPRGTLASRDNKPQIDTAVARKEREAGGWRRVWHWLKCNVGSGQELAHTNDTCRPTICGSEIQHEQFNFNKNAHRNTNTKTKELLIRHVFRRPAAGSGCVCEVVCLCVCVCGKATCINAI